MGTQCRADWPRRRYRRNPPRSQPSARGLLRPVCFQCKFAGLQQIVNNNRFPANDSLLRNIIQYNPVRPEYYFQFLKILEKYIQRSFGSLKSHSANTPNPSLVSHMHKKILCIQLTDIPVDSFTLRPFSISKLINVFENIFFSYDFKSTTRNHAQQFF